jgi:hypothetical protein
MSPEGGRVNQALSEVRNQQDRSIALTGKTQAVLSSLRVLLEESDIDFAALEEAEGLIRLLPRGIPAPEFASEDDGAIMMEWLPSRQRMVSVSVAGRGRLAYAWLNGSERGYGVARFNSRKFPEVLLQVVRSVVGADPSVWTP